jgi:MFS family permease
VSEATAAPPPRRALMPQHAIMAAFFMQAFAGGGLYPRIPDIQTGLGIGEGGLGLVLMGQPAGAFSAIVLSSFMIERIGPKTILSVSIPMIALTALLIALAPDPATLFLAMLVFGIAFSAANMAMNVEADRVEAATGTRVMNRCHGMWSLGFLAASTLGAAARGVPLSVLAHFAIVLPLVLAAAALAVWPMRGQPPRSHAGAARKKVFVLPTPATLLLVGVIIAGIMADSTVRAWSVIFMRDTFSAAPWVEALTLPAFLATLTAGRLIGDRLVARHGPVRACAGLMAFAFAGLGLVLLAHDVYSVLAGFALLGFGVSILFPQTMSAAARIGDRPASENVASIAIVTNIVMLATPGLIGLIAERFGIHAAFLVLLPLFLMALRLTPRLGRGHQTTA